MTDMIDLAAVALAIRRGNHAEFLVEFGRDLERRVDDVRGPEQEQRVGGRVRCHRAKHVLLEDRVLVAVVPE